MKCYSHNGCSTSTFLQKCFRDVKGVSNIGKRDKHDKTEKIEKVIFGLFYIAKNEECLFIDAFKIFPACDLWCFKFNDKKGVLYYMSN